MVGNKHHTKNLPTNNILILENTLSGHVGLVISQILILTGLVQYGVRQGTDVASNMVSVERVMQYTKLEKEHPLETGQKPPREWPSKGKIHFKNTYISYAPELSPVLKDLNIKIGSAEKVGIFLSYSFCPLLTYFLSFYIHFNYFLSLANILISSKFFFFSIPIFSI